MKIYLFVDMEGISGICNREMVMPSGSHYQEGRRLYTQDANACIRGCFDAGAQSVVVRDGHGSGFNFLLDDLDQRVDVVQGPCAYQRLPGIEGSDALILLGYHAMAGTAQAVLEHTFSSATIQQMWLNGRAVGEFGLDAAVAAAYGVPVILVSGDDKICREAQAFVPEIVTCLVKTGFGCQCARMMAPQAAHLLIEEKTVEAIRRIEQIPPPTVALPVTLRMEMVERQPIPHAISRPNVTVIDGRTYEVTADAVEAALLQIFG